MTNILYNIALTLVVLVVAVLVYLGWLGLRQPVLAKIGLRNIPRRPTQSILIVVGLTLSTIIIISALSIGDTLNYSVQRQAVAAYGNVDEIIAPPLISLLASLGGSGNQANSGQTDSGQTDSEQTDSGQTDSRQSASEQQQQLQNLTEGGLTSLLTVLQGGLPGISMERYEQLRAEAAQEPLIDGVAGSILFPTIIRNTSTGQGEPLGIVFGVDQYYDQQFGINTIEGEPVTMAALKPGVGNIFLQAANVFGMAQDLATQAGLTTNVSDLVMAAAGVGAALTSGGQGTGFDLSSLSVTTKTLQSLGINTQPLEAQGIQTVTLESLGITTATIASIGQQLGITSTVVQPTAILSNALGLDTRQIVSATTGLLSSFNLNTLGAEIDRSLEPYGLQLRQGDVYLNRLGAQQLAADVGDVLEIYVGPVPIPMRVKAVVEEAGPLGALLPVVMVRLDEAQKLFFMNGKVNNLLISNQGDELEGMTHTEAVSKRLRVLAMDKDALNEVVAILRRPAVKAALVAAAANARQSAFGGDPNDQPPAWLAPIIENFTPMGGIIEQLQTLPAELEKPEISDALRNALGEQTMRGWLLNDNTLPAADEADLRAAMGKLNQFDLIDGLNKTTVVTVANAAGGVFSSIFSLFGIFSILAAILLIFLIFVMLAAERRSEMGIARAIGVQRRHLVQMFVTEGMVYDLVAAALGVALGLGVSYAMIGFLGNLFNDVAGQFNSVGILEFHFRAAPTSIVIGYCLGVLFTYLVVAFSSWRVSRLNIVTAIRDLPEEAIAKQRSLLRRIWRWLVGPLLATAGAYLIWLGVNGALTYWLMGGTLALVGIVLLVERLLELTRLRQEVIQRMAYTVIGLGLLIIWGVPWNTVLGLSAMDILRQEQGWILLTFSLTGPLLILGAIMVIMFNASVFTWIASTLLGGVRTLTPVLKTAIAYPLSARFRTGMAMVMFAMIIATVVIMAVVIEATQSIIVLDIKDTAGFEISTSNTLLSFFNPLGDLEAEIPRQIATYPRLADIEAVGAIGHLEVGINQSTTDTDWGRASLAGVNNGYLAQAEKVYSFQARAPGYADDAAVWQALRERDDVAIVTPNLLLMPEPDEASLTDANAEGRGVTEARRQQNRFRRFRLSGIDLTTGALPEIFIEARPQVDPDNPLDNSAATTTQPAQRLQIIAVLTDETTLADGDIQANLRALSRIKGEIVNPDAFYVKVKAGADVRAVQMEVERALLGNGINASILAESFALGQNVTRGILQIFQGFMALGLLVGIAALGVITSRTVVERRQQIGMLRAIGFQSNMVALSLVLEASFIAITGLVIGAGTGILLGENMVRTFFTELTPQTQFSLPWLQIGGILLVAYLFALLMTIVPAYQAARIYPAEALRYE